MEADGSTATNLPRLAPRRAEPKGELRRAAVLESLERLLQEQPLQQVSVGEIASRAGITRSGFYFYFPSKEAAVTELLQHVFAEMIDGARAWIDGEGDPRESLLAAMTQLVTLWRQHDHLVLAMLDARDDPAVRELWVSWVELFVEPLAGAVQAERERGRAPSEGPPATVVIRLLLGMNERALEDHARRHETAAEGATLAATLAHTWWLVIYGAVPAP